MHPTLRATGVQRDPHHLYPLLSPLHKGRLAPARTGVTIGLLEPTALRAPVLGSDAPC